MEKLLSLPWISEKSKEMVANSSNKGFKIGFAII